MLFKHSNNDVFRWKVQSIKQMSDSAAEQMDLVAINGVKSELSKGDRDMHMKNPISQAISRGDDDDLLKLNGKSSGHKSIYTFDANKHYSPALKFRCRPYVVAW